MCSITLEVHHLAECVGWEGEGSLRGRGIENFCLCYQGTTALSASLWGARGYFANRFETPLLNTLMPEVWYHHARPPKDEDELLEAGEVSKLRSCDPMEI
jgi:hypothetical protein